MGHDAFVCLLLWTLTVWWNISVHDGSKSWPLSCYPWQCQIHRSFFFTFYVILCQTVSPQPPPMCSTQLSDAVQSFCARMLTTHQRWRGREILSWLHWETETVARLRLGSVPGHQSTLSSLRYGLCDGQSQSGPWVLCLIQRTASPIPQLPHHYTGIN